MTENPTSDQQEKERARYVQRAVSEYEVALAIVKEHQQTQRLYSGHTLPDQLRGVLTEYQDVARNALSLSKDFRDRMVVNLKAMSIVLGMVASASTHREKDARLRGCIEITEKAVDQLLKEQFDIAVCQQPRFDCIFDPFRSDFPTRHFVDRIHELEEQVESLRKNQKEVPLEPDDKEVPFN
jgi:hypothetical protein